MKQFNKTSFKPSQSIIYSTFNGYDIKVHDDTLSKYFTKSTKNNQFYQNSEQSELSITYQQFKNGQNFNHSILQQSRLKKDNQGININLNQSLEKIRQDLNRKYGNKNNSNFGPIVNNNNFIPPKASQEDFEPQPESGNDGFFNKVVNFFKSCVNCSTVPSITIPSITTVPPVVSSMPYVNNFQERQTITYKGFKAYNNTRNQLPIIYENNICKLIVVEDGEVYKMLGKRRDGKGGWVKN